MKNVCLLGSTGYIGTNTLTVIKGNPDRYRVIALGAGRNIDLLLQQIKEFEPRFAAVLNSDLAQELRNRINNTAHTEILYGTEGYTHIATLADLDVAIAAMTGASGLVPTFSAIAAGKDVALANKEALVIAGSLLMRESKKSGVNIFPIDSEHSAIAQAIQGHRREDLKRIILTASGGAFRDLSKDELFKMCEEDPRAVQAKATTHPNWDLGAKITLDSATMMNKGLEVRNLLLCDVKMFYNKREYCMMIMFFFRLYGDWNQAKESQNLQKERNQHIRYVKIY